MEVPQEVHNSFCLSFYRAGFNSNLMRDINLSLNDNFQWLISDFRPLLLLFGLELCFSRLRLLYLHVVHCCFQSHLQQELHPPSNFLDKQVCTAQLKFGGVPVGSSASFCTLLFRSAVMFNFTIRAAFSFMCKSF